MWIAVFRLSSIPWAAGVPMLHIHLMSYSYLVTPVCSINTTTLALQQTQAQRRPLTCQQLLPYMPQQRHTHTQQAVQAAAGVRQQSVPDPNSIRKGKFLSQQQRDPPEGKKLGIHLVTAKSINGMQRPAMGVPSQRCTRCRSMNQHIDQQREKKSCTVAADGRLLVC